MFVASHRQIGSAEVLLGRSFLEHQHHGAHRDAATRDPRGSAPPAPKNDFAYPSDGAHRDAATGAARFRKNPLNFFLLLCHFV